MKRIHMQWSWHVYGCSVREEEHIARSGARNTLFTTKFSTFAQKKRPASLRAFSVHTFLATPDLRPGQEEALLRCEATDERWALCRYRTLHRLAPDLEPTVYAVGISVRSSRATFAH